ncbi:TB2/DP1, HVA22 family-domain-containing protein [Lipomyces kononenkoae]|uniref:TB2/DP1, HVA22 family-domain-containing protein n=1 Tax=Lipomyces kononenkoae TaxID=34357 RepID=A0ACC3SZR6_LIPKO
MSYQDQIFAGISKLDKELNKYQILDKLEKQTGVPKAYGVLGAVGVYLFLIFLNFGGIGELLANLAGLIIPGYYSLIALETPGTADDTQYLTYWVVFAFFSVIEFWSRAILYWIPFYWFFKVIFVLYLGLPQFNGAKVVYKVAVKPISVKLIKQFGPTSVAPTLKEKVDAASTAKTTGASI